MIALLDANILIDVGKAALVPKLVSLATAAPWSITRAVFDELPSLSGRSLLRSLIRSSPALGTAEAALHTELVSGGRWAGLGNGESASIAAAAHDLELVFVTWDKAASWRSLHELRGRTTVGHAWLQDLVDRGLLSQAEAAAVVRADPTRHHPTWWSSP